MDGALTGGSHRIGAYGHEYPRFLAMRQVQPSERAGGERALFRFFGAKRGWSIDVTFLFWRKMRAVGFVRGVGVMEMAACIYMAFNSAFALLFKCSYTSAN
jgi:hypothetical protein